MNPCRCGYLGDDSLACKRAPECAVEYQAKISGPLLDRIDCHVDVPMVASEDLIESTKEAEETAIIAQRVIQTRAIQAERYRRYLPETQAISMTNAVVDTTLLEKVAEPDLAGKKPLSSSGRRLSPLSPRLSSSLTGGPNLGGYGKTRAGL